APERLVALLLGRVPVQALPVRAEQPVEGVAGRQGDADAVAAFLRHRVRLDEIVAVHEIHGVFTPLTGAHYIVTPPSHGRSPAPSRSAQPSNRRVTGT